jgi:hypothetical protein
LGGTLLVTNAQINQITTYQFTLSVANTLQQNCVFLFTFPSGILTTSLSQCINGFGISNGLTTTIVSTTTLRCTCNSGISNSNPSYIVTVIYSFLTWQLNNIQNPGSAKTVSTVGVQVYSGSTLIEQKTDFTKTFTSVVIASTRG